MAALLRGDTAEEGEGEGAGFGEGFGADAGHVVARGVPPDAADKVRNEVDGSNAGSAEGEVVIHVGFISKLPAFGGEFLLFHELQVELCKGGQCRRGGL